MPSPISAAFGMPPKDAMEYLGQKGYEFSFSYKELQTEAHHKAFTVAKVMKLDLMTDIHDSLQAAQKSNQSFDEWKKSITPALKKAGWWGETTVTDPRTGETKDVHVGSRRLKTIYATNMNVAYAVGRYKELMRLPDSVFWRYRTRDDGKVRISHSLLNGMVRHRDDPIWKRIYPPNDWLCRCLVDAHTKEQVATNGWSVDTGKPLPDGFAPHPDWDYDVGAGASYKPEQLYWQKINAMTCKEPNAKVREVLCPFADATKKGYAEDMRKLLPKKEEWDAFVERSLPDPSTKHEEMRLGHLSMIDGLGDFLRAKAPQSDLILATTGSVKNLRAKSEGSKKGKVLEIDEIKELFKKIHKPDEIYYDGEILLFWDFDNGKNKIMLKVDFEDKRRIYNAIYSGQKYKSDSLENILKNAEKIL